MSPALGFVALLICVFISHLISEKAFKALNDEEKIKLMDAFSGVRKWKLAPLIIVLLLFALSDQLDGPLATSIGITGFVSILVYLLFMHLLIRKKLKALALPIDYGKKVMIARCISYAGIGAMVIIMLI